MKNKPNFGHDLTIDLYSDEVHNFIPPVERRINFSVEKDDAKYGNYQIIEEENHLNVINEKLRKKTKKETKYIEFNHKYVTNQPNSTKNSTRADLSEINKGQQSFFEFPNSFKCNSSKNLDFSNRDMKTAFPKSQYMNSNSLTQIQSISPLIKRRE
jgi:hypothetical protein